MSELKADHNGIVLSTVLFLLVNLRFSLSMVLHRLLVADMRSFGLRATQNLAY